MEEANEYIATCSTCGLDFNETEINMIDYDFDLCEKCEKEHLKNEKFKKTASGIDQFVIQLNGLYLKGETDTSQSITYDEVVMDSLSFVRNQDEARIIEGHFNLKSYLDRIYSRMKMKTIKIHELRILNVG